MLEDIDFEQLLGQRPGVNELHELIKREAFFELPPGAHPRMQSKKIDKLLGYRIPKIERNLLKKYRAYDTAEQELDRKQHYQGTETWIGLHPQVLQTPYSDIYHFLKRLQQYKPKVIVDLGAAYGRMPIVMNALDSDCEFIGFEIMRERLDEANRMHRRLQLHRCSMREQNILDDDFELPLACIYFIYDFSNPMDIRKILNKLKEKLHKDRFFIVVTGEGVRSLIQLKFPEFWSLHGVIHHKGWSLYSSFTDLT